VGLSPLFLGSLLVGLLLGVAAMLYGVQRVTPDRPVVGRSLEPAPRPRTRWNLPLWASFATAFGVTGYLIARASTLHPGAVVAIAAGVAAAVATGALVLVAKWAVAGAGAHEEDERYLLQGHFGRVVVDADGATTIVFTDAGVETTLPVRAVDDTPLVSGAEVVIERVEDGVVWVESWERVEARL